VRGAPEEAGTRLAAVTIHAKGLRALVRVMGAHVEPVQPRAADGELTDQLGIDRVEDGFREVAAGDARLVSDHDGRHARRVQPADGVRGARQEPEAADVIDIPHLLGEAAVTVDEDGGAVVQHRGEV
jgi:hypothetical protein